MTTRLAAANGPVGGFVAGNTSSTTSFEQQARFALRVGAGAGGRGEAAEEVRAAAAPPTPSRATPAAAPSPAAAPTAGDLQETTDEVEAASNL